MRVSLKQAGDWLVIHGHCDVVEVKEVIRLVNNGKGWHVAVSSCMPTDLAKAYDQQRVINAAFKLLRDYEADTADVGEVRHLGTNEDMKGIGER